MVRGVIIGHTRIDWQLFAKICRETLGLSPLSVVDDRGLDQNQPMSFCYSIENFTHDMERTFDHISISFLIQIDVLDATKFIEEGLKTVVISESVKMTTFIATGTFREFYDLILRPTNDQTIKAIHTFYLRELERIGFKPLFKKFQREINNGFITLKS